MCEFSWIKRSRFLNLKQIYCCFQSLQRLFSNKIPKTNNVCIIIPIWKLKHSDWIDIVLLRKHIDIIQHSDSIRKNINTLNRCFTVCNTLVDVPRDCRALTSNPNDWLHSTATKNCQPNARQKRKQNSQAADALDWRWCEMLRHISQTNCTEFIINNHDHHDYHHHHQHCALDVTCAMTCAKL